MKQQQLKRPIIMSTVEEGHSPVKKKQDKVGRKGKTEVIDKTNNSSSTTYENISDVQYQQRLTEKVRMFTL